MVGLYGRDKELGLLETLLARSDKGHIGIMVVSGPRGIGKSRLLSSAARLSARSGLEVVRLNFAGLSGISHRYFLDELSAGHLEEFTRRWSDWVGFYAPGDRAGPVVVALDDVEWPGSVMASVGVFHRLARRMGRPLVVLLACRGDAEDPTRANDEEVHRNVDSTVDVVHCRLHPLEGKAVRQLAADVLGMPPGQEVMDMCAHAEGVPGRLLPVLNGLAEAGVTCAPDGTAQPDLKKVLPLEARVLAFERLAGLSDGTRHVLDIASVMGKSFTLGALSSALGQTALSLLPALREAQEAGVLAKDSSCSAFTDLLMWQAVRETVPAPVRTAVLRDVGHQLLVSGDAAPLGAGYLLRAACSGDRRAASSLPEAVARQARTDPVGAATHAAEALRLPHLDEAGHARLVQVRAEGLARCGQLTEAIQCLNDGLQRPLRLDSANLLRSILTFLHMLSGDTESAAAVARQVLGRRGSAQAPREIALLLDYRSYRWGDVVRTESRPESDPAARTSLGPSTGFQAFGSFFHWRNGRVTETLGMLDGADGTEPSQLWLHQASRTFATVTRIQHLASLRGFGEAEAELQAVAAGIDAWRGQGWHAVTESLRALLALEQGQLQVADAAATAGLDLGQKHGTGALALLAHAVLAIASLRRMDMQTALRHTEILSDPLQANRSSGATQVALWAVLMVTEAHEGPQAAVHLAERLLSEGVSSYSMLLQAPYSAPWLVRTALTAGLPEFAAKTAVAAESLAEYNPDWPILTIAAEHARGLLEGDTTALRLAVERHQDPWSRAQAQEDLAGMTESQEVAVRHLEAAANSYTRSGARRDAARVRHRLRERGVRRRHWNSVARPLAGWRALTETECAIARLVAAGMTNRQAAQQMSLSHHTVNFHLRNIYRKLDISSRVKLAAIVHQ
ncbi:LuxR C-terminal-related transcriptional regulator [Streptomyces tubercidicus]|uniref:LuxR C-terminal-related transcriptional regulator n=1 Tax=Streptomyces tubercidicus TaxID=47759 RepID=UPI003467C955